MPETTTGETPPEARTETVTPAALVEPMGERMPPVSEGQHAAPASAPVAPSVPPSGPVLRDSRGIKFSPARHQVNPDGAPKRNSKGNFILTDAYRAEVAAGLRRRSGASPVTSSSPAGAPRPAPQFNDGAPRGDPNIPAAPVGDQYDAAAEMYLQITYGPVVVAFSENARPDGDDHSALKTALAQYLRANQVSEPSPGWSLLFTAAAVAVKKSADPVVKERAADLGGRVKKWFEPAPQPAPDQK